VPTGNAITVIDDSYNANPVGVHNGLEVLSQLEARSRILVTPGLVELGAVEDEENRRYGEHAARVCDHVIVMDARPARALREGLRAGGMPDDRVHVVRSLAEATEMIGRIAGAGDAVLFANDLPDTYLGAA
jgi:UDP-N-acetylmuramoyl-tripeptide--D-alanyl-D-alanine ligase